MQESDTFVPTIYDEYYTVQETAVKIGRTDRNIYYRIRMGTVPHIKIWGRLYIPKSYVDSIIKGKNWETSQNTQEMASRLPDGK